MTKRTISLLFFSFFIIGCPVPQDNDLEKRIITALLNQKVNPVDEHCSNFAITESLCAANPDSSSVTCSDSQLEAVKKGIMPEEKRTDSVRNAYFTCWNRCNLVFNTNEPICNSSSKFKTTKNYRDAQKSDSTAQSKNWILCMNNCNKGGSQEQGLTETYYPKPAY